MLIGRASLALIGILTLAPVMAAAQEGGSGIGNYLEELQREVEERAPALMDDARQGLGTAETFGRNLVDRWRVCSDSPQSAAPVCRVLTDGEGGALDPSPGSLDRLFERLDAIAAPYNDRSRTAATLRADWASFLGIAPDGFGAAPAVRAIFERIRTCSSWPCPVLDRDLLNRTVIFLTEQDTEGYPAAERIRGAYGL